MEKFCVFCGERPESKSKEHVIPQWVLSMTGDPKRALTLHFPYDMAGAASREIAFDAFHFPACSECNTEFSELETKAKVVVERMFNYAGLSARDISILLDWLDKVRIGLWLGAIYLAKNPFSVSPNFHIGQRIGSKDRLVVIYRVDDDRAGIRLLGTNVPIFHMLPCCFTLAINEFYFFNVSADFLLARRVGFPYPGRMKQMLDGRLELKMQEGWARRFLPLVKLNYSKEGTELFQPMFLNEVLLSDPGIYDNDYVRDLSVNWDTGIGWPLYAKDSVVEKYPLLATQDWVPRKSHKRSQLHFQLIRQTLNFQADIWDYLYSNFSPNVNKAMARLQEINRKWSKCKNDELSSFRV